MKRHAYWRDIHHYRIRGKLLQMMQWKYHKEDLAQFEVYWNHTSIEDTIKVFWFNGTPHFRGSYVCLQLIPITTS